MSEAETPLEDEIPENGTEAQEEQSSEPQDPLEVAMTERDENHDRWLRSQAELENFRRRAQKEAEEMRRYQTLPLIRDLLPGMDNLERAVSAAENSSNVEELLQGVRMVVQQFENTLGNHSLKPIEAIGQPFDPNLHEAIQQLPSADHPPMTVIQELERGYTLYDRVVRPSKVIVSSAPPENNEEK